MGTDWTGIGRAADNVLQTIGRTPMVRLNRIPKVERIEAEVLVKLEYTNPSSSLKDRIYYEMIRAAVESGELRPGMEILEASTGNAGIACSFVGGLLGYKVTIVMPAGMSEERKKTIRAFGGQLILTPGGESDVDLCKAKIAELKAQYPGKYWEPGQFENPVNPLAHYRTTAPEIWEQTDGKVDCFLATQGTGGTLTGIGRCLKERDGGIKLYAVEPTEAPLLSKRLWGAHRIQGIGDGFVPRNLDVSLLDGVVLTTSDEAITMARRLSIEEGIFCGISSGSNVAAAVKVARRHPELKRIVTMVNDRGDRYLSTELTGEAVEVEIPEREHPLDEYTVQQLDRYQSRWEIIE